MEELPVVTSLDTMQVTTYHYHMYASKKRTSFALDEQTLLMIHALAGRWRVSQAEVVRRAVRHAAEADRSDTETLVARFRDYWKAGALAAERAEAYLAEVASDRAVWDRGTATGGVDR